MRLAKLPGILCLVLVVLYSQVQADSIRPTIYVYDLRSAVFLPAGQRFDAYHSGVCLQGLANRQAPRVFLIHGNDESTWLDRLREPGGLCEDWPVYTVGDFDELLYIFAQYVNGAVLYDPDPATGVISTSLVATTVAGVEGGIAVRKDPAPDSMYNHLVNDPDGPRLPVLLDLTGRFTGSGTIWQTSTPSTGSRKCDAYIWAKEKYIDAGKCNPTVVTYALDLWGLQVGSELRSNAPLDYAVSKQGFCFELSPWGDEIPNDDPTQPLGTDLDTYKAILNACNNRTAQTAMIKFCGFPNWEHKYTDRVGGIHEPVATEWETIRLITAYNAYQEPDFTLSNASFYDGLGPAIAGRRYVQNPPPTYDDMVSGGLIEGSGEVVPGNYIMVGLGDYDSPSWTLNQLAISRYGDGLRGQVYCNWGVNPNLVDRASAALDYMYRNKTEKDFFVAWDSGAGYINPGQLYGSRAPSGYPSGVRIWQTHCRHYYGILDYSISAWLLHGYLRPPGTTDYRNYAPFSGDGIGVFFSSFSTPKLESNVPVSNVDSNGLDSSSSPVINYSSGAHFAWYRTVLWYPNKVKQLEDNWSDSGNNHRFLDAYTYYYLIRHYLGGNNDYRATWLSHTIPRVMAAGQTYPVTITVRNDGWDTWSEAARYRLSYAFVPRGGSVDPVMVVDNDGLHSARERSGAIWLSAGKHPITVTFFEKTGDAVLEVRYQGPGIAKQLIPDSALFTRGNPGANGLDYAYYEGSWNNLPDFDSLTPEKTGVIDNFSLSPAQNNDYFGFKYTGYVQVPTEGAYIFYTRSDDGSRLFISGADFASRHYLPGGVTVAPGQSTAFSVSLSAPVTNGRYDLLFDMVRDGVTWFRWRNNIEYKTEIVVAANEQDVDTDEDGLPDVWEEANGLLYWHPDDNLPGRATNPSPAHQAAGTSRFPILSWTAGERATSHDVYFGPASPPAFQGNQTETTFDPGVLDPRTVYYWRIDEVNTAGTVNGNIWNFTTKGCPDFDADGDVDQEDFGHFQACLSGPGAPQTDPDCQDALLDGDEDVDRDDFGIFQSCLSGPNVPAEPDCAG